MPARPANASSNNNPNITLTGLRSNRANACTRGNVPSTTLTRNTVDSAAM